MIQDDAKELLKKIGEPFDKTHRKRIFAEIDQFAAGADKAKLMGAMIKAYLEREWQFKRTPELATLQKFVGGDFNINKHTKGYWEQPTWDAQPPSISEDAALYHEYGKRHLFHITDRLHEDAKHLTVYLDDGLRNITMLHYLTRDALERKERWGKEGRLMANTMAVLLFDDASYPLPKPAKGNRLNGTDYCTLHGQEWLAKNIRTSGYNPFEDISIAEVGGIKHHDDKLIGDKLRSYFTIILRECPVVGLCKAYKNVGGEKFREIGAGQPVNLATQQQIFGNEKFDYFVTNNVVSRGSGMQWDVFADRDVHEEKAQRELVATGANILKVGGASLHLGADLMRAVARVPVWEEETRGKKTEKVSRRNNDLWPFMGFEEVNGFDVKREDRAITTEALAAFEEGKTWEELSGVTAAFSAKVGGQKPPTTRGGSNSKKIRSK